MRRPLAIATLCVWALGIELVPGLHVALHDLWAHHHHHGDEPHHAEGGGESEAPVEHGEDSLEHGQLALLDPPPPPSVTRAELVAIVGAAALGETAPRSRRPAAVRQRGPPAAG